MKKLAFLFSVAFFGISTAFIQKSKSKLAEQNPNVIIIVADDLGYNDVGFNGCLDIPTPNIDRIASAGVVFSSGHVTFGVCSPSRAGLLLVVINIVLAMNEIHSTFLPTVRWVYL